MFFKFTPTAKGYHCERVNGAIVTYNSGADVVIESASDLATRFPDKFVQIKAPAGDPAGKPGVPGPAGELGIDVTENYDGAAEEGLLVFEDEGKCYVTEVETPSTPLNDKPLTVRKVAPFIKKYLNR